MKLKTFLLMIAMILGSITGLLFKDFSLVIKPFGTLFLNLMFTIVVPLVFFTISTAIMKNKKNINKVLLKTLKYFFITSLVATLVMLIVTLIFNPACNINVTETLGKIEKPNILEKIVSSVSVNDFNLLLSKSNMLALIIFSMLFGYGTKSKNVINLFEDIKNSLLKVIDIIMYYAPIGIFAFMASTISEYGNDVFKSYVYVFVLYYIVSFVYFVLINTLISYKYNKFDGVKMFFKNIIPSFACSLTTQSSLATLPTNIEVADKMGIDKKVTDITLPLGATMHMEGSCMSAILKIVFLFTIFNIPYLTVTNVLTSIIVAILSGIVMSGIPGGGLIGEALIVSLYGFPTQALGYLATIGYIVDAPATMLNATNDISVSMLISKSLEKES